MTGARADRPGDTRCVLYLRVSSAGQEDNYSLPTQEERCRSYAAARGWTVVGAYREVHTGAELFERPLLGRMRAALRAGEATMVVAYALDRVSRSQTHLGFLLSEWESLGVRLELVSETLDDTPEGRLIQSVRSFSAELERLKIKERTERGKRARVEAGKLLPGRKPPFGYLWADPATKERLVEDPSTAPVVRRLFREVANGTSTKALAALLTAEAVPTPDGHLRPWQRITISRILRHPVYAGHPVAYRHVWDKSRTGRRHSRVMERADAVALPAGVAPALVSPEEQEAVLARLERNRAEATRHNKQPESTLFRCGFVRCGICGRPLAVANRKSGPTFRCIPDIGMRPCPVAINAAPLEAELWLRVEHVLTRPEIIAAEVARRHDAAPRAADLAALDRRLRDIAARQAKLARLAAALDDEDATAPLLAELRALAIQKRELEADRVGLTALAAGEAADAARMADLAMWCGRVSGNLPRLTYDERRDVLHALGVRVDVFPKDHSPRWRMTMRPEDVAPVTSDGAVAEQPTRSSSIAATAKPPPRPASATCWPRSGPSSPVTTRTPGPSGSTTTRCRSSRRSRRPRPSARTRRRCCARCRRMPGIGPRGTPNPAPTRPRTGCASTRSISMTTPTRSRATSRPGADAGVHDGFRRIGGPRTPRRLGHTRRTL